MARTAFGNLTRNKRRYAFGSLSAGNTAQQLRNEADEFFEQVPNNLKKGGNYQSCFEALDSLLLGERARGAAEQAEARENIPEMEPDGQVRREVARTTLLGETARVRFKTHCTPKDPSWNRERAQPKAQPKKKSWWQF